MKKSSESSTGFMRNLGQVPGIKPLMFTIAITFAKISELIAQQNSDQAVIHMGITIREFTPEEKVALGTEGYYADQKKILAGQIVDVNQKIIDYEREQQLLFDNATNNPPESFGSVPVDYVDLSTMEILITNGITLKSGEGNSFNVLVDGISRYEVSLGSEVSNVEVYDMEHRYGAEEGEKKPLVGFRVLAKNGRVSGLILIYDDRIIHGGREVAKFERGDFLQMLRSDLSNKESQYEQAERDDKAYGSGMKVLEVQVD